MRRKVLLIIKQQAPEADPDISGKFPVCAGENCRSYSVGLCGLTGIRPGDTCEPAVEVLGNAIEAFLDGMLGEERLDGG